MPKHMSRGATPAKTVPAGQNYLLREIEFWPFLGDFREMWPGKKHRCIVKPAVLIFACNVVHVAPTCSRGSGEGADEEVVVHILSTRALLAIVGVLVGATSFFSNGESLSAKRVLSPRDGPRTAPLATNKAVNGIVPNIIQTSGNCTNPQAAGAFSGAALASQAIGDLAGSSTIVETTTAIKAIEERRETPPEACPSGQVLVDGICKPPPAPVTEVAAPPAVPAVSAPSPRPPGLENIASKAKAVSRAPSVALPTKKAVYEAPPPAIYDQSFRIGSWAQGFGDYEHRTGDGNVVINCCAGASAPSNTNITPLALDATSTTSSGGFVGGIDGTKRGLFGPQDGIIFGLLGGYTWTNISLETTALSSIPSQTASGSSRTTAHIDGPSVGGYLSYFNGPLSNDFLIKDDFLSLNETSSQILGFGTCSCFI